MRYNVKYWLIIINNFLHDMFTGMWASALIVIYLLRRQIPLVHGIPPETFRDIIKVFFWLGIFSLIVIVFTGIIRIFYYRGINDMAIEIVKKKILIIKHVLLGIIFVAGTYLAYSYAFY